MPIEAITPAAAHVEPADSPAATGIRRLLLVVLLLGILGSIVELLLLSHFEDRWQLIPLAVFGLALISIVALLAHRVPMSVRAVQGAMSLLILAGAAGVVLHFQANAEFQTDIDPTISRTALFWKSIRATAPPALAPGVMVLLGLVGFAYTFRHPALAGRKVAGNGE